MFNRAIILTLVIVCQTFVGIALADDKPVYVMDFGQGPDGDATAWLKSNSIDLMLDANKLNKTFRNGALTIETEGSIAGMFGLDFDKEDYVPNVKTIRIEWGVDRFPQGADWENGNNKVPVAIMFSFGDKKLASGLPFGINPAPYFLSPFIGKKEKLDKVYVGKLYKKGGRYFCVSNGGIPLGKTITTEFEVDDRFKELFEYDETPPITGYAFQMNTKDTEGGASAFIRKIEFFAD